jgi:hypothetical protein
MSHRTAIGAVEMAFFSFVSKNIKYLGEIDRSFRSGQLVDLSVLVIHL